jgi:TatD DNase family protein
VLIDTHCHFNLKKQFPDPASAIASSVAAGVGRMIVVGIDAETSRYAVELAAHHSEVYATVGWHPTSTAGFGLDWLNEIRELAKHPKVLAIGEIGLDYHWPDSPPSDQFRALEAQWELAEELGLPVVYHVREAFQDMLGAMEKRGFPLAQVLHCFAGDHADAERALELGCFFGVDGPLTYPKAVELREIMAWLPVDRILLETDSPFLTPAPYRGKPNSPALLPLVAEKLAEVRGVSREDIAQITTANARRCFGRGLGL